MATLGPLASALGPLGASLASMAPATTASQTTGTGSHTGSQTGSGRSSPDDALGPLRTSLSPLGGSPATSPSPQPPLGLPSLPSPLSSPLSSPLASLSPAVLHQMHQSLLHGPMPPQPSAELREHHREQQRERERDHHHHHREREHRERERDHHHHRERLGGAVGALGALTQLRLQASLSPPSGLTINGHGGHHGASGVNGGHHVLNGTTTTTTTTAASQQHALKFNDSSSSGSSKSQECQYVATQRGGMALLFEGHRYNKVRDGREGTVYWRCARDRQCPGRAVTVYSRIKKANNKHNHPPDSWRGPGQGGSSPSSHASNNACNNSTTASNNLSSTKNSNNHNNINNNNNSQSNNHSSNNNHHHHHHHSHNNNNNNNNNNNGASELTQLGGPEQPLDLKMLSALGMGGAGRSSSPSEVLTPAAIAQLGHLPTLFTETLKYLASSHAQQQQQQQQQQQHHQIQNNHQGTHHQAQQQHNSHTNSITNALNSALNSPVFNLPVFPAPLKSKSPQRSSNGGVMGSGGGGLPALINHLRDSFRQQQHPDTDSPWWMLNAAANAVVSAAAAAGASGGEQLPSEPLDMAMRGATVAGIGMASALKRLRALIKAQPEGISAYIIPHNDAHLSEYISSTDARLEFISGFTGSLGTAIVTEDQSALWTDGRYYKQAENELTAHAAAHGHQPWTLMKEGLPDTLEPHQWLSKVLPAKGKVGVDPLLISYTGWERLSQKLEGAGHKLVPITHNLIDQVWDERPSPPETAVEVLPLSLAGRSWQEKLADVRSDLKAKNAQALVVTALDEIAWLFNLRGSDIEFNPVFFAYAVVTSKSAHLFVHEDKITVSLEKHLTSSATSPSGDAGGSRSGDARMDTSGDSDQSGQQVQQSATQHPHQPALPETVDIQPYWVFREFLSMLIQQRSGRVWVSPKSSYSIVSIVPEERRIFEQSTIQVRKAVKNSTEIEGMKKAHIRDAAAMCEFLCWLEREVPKGGVTEVSAADKLESFRRAQTDFVGLSFATISASGPNGAIIHYKPTKDSDRAITVDDLYLIDSGGQYRDGTTDITRTVHFGKPTAAQREYFTRVMKGVILLTTAKFPRLIKGIMIDTLGRKSLWDVGLDYVHGTGHGVGAYLNVHEGPFSISFRENPYDCGLREGMFSSIEPGYYKEDDFGIRIENVAVVVPAKTDYEKPFLTFETVTLVPVQSDLLDPTMLSKEEIEWINAYHEQCRLVVGKLLEETGKEAALKWLLRETQPIG